MTAILTRGEAHVLILHRTDRFLRHGEWWATCEGCPGWQGRVEGSRPEAIRWHTVHAALESGWFV